MNDLEFSCETDNVCQCFYETSLPISECAMTGEDVLTEFEYEDTKVWLWILILIIQIVVYRVLFWLVIRRSFKSK